MREANTRVCGTLGKLYPAQSAWDALKLMKGNVITNQPMQKMASF